MQTAVEQEQTQTPVIHESLMQELPDKKEVINQSLPETSCERCTQALQIGESLFATMVSSTFTDISINYTISVDIRHNWMEPFNAITEQFPYKMAWEHTLVLYNHTRREYVMSASVKVIINPVEHEHTCAYAHIIVEFIKAAQASVLVGSITSLAYTNILREARFLTGTSTVGAFSYKNCLTMTYQI